MKDYKFFILTILAIILLSFATHWQFKNFHKSLSGIEFPKFEMPKLELPPLQESEGAGYKEFVSPDGKLKLKYSSDWMEMKGLEKLNQETIKERAKILLFAQKFRLEKAAFASLVIQELSLEKEKKLEKVIEEMKKETEEKGIEMEVLKLETKDKEANLEAKYKKERGSVLHSKEKIILSENKAYLITFVALDRDWSEFEKEIGEILSSAQIID
ncbi:MAG: hypothetical protein ACE5J0_00255 [Candidatus Paceibacterales bacterium]